jgi:hypothetical protein
MFRSRVDNAYDNIIKQLRIGGNRGVHQTLSRREYEALRDQYLGPNYITNVRKDGYRMHTSEDGHRFGREPAYKEFSVRYQAKFQARTDLSQNGFDRNVHVDIELPD